MPDQPRRVAAFSLPRVHRPLPLLALHMPFGDVAVMPTLSIHEEVPPAHLAGRTHGQDALSCVSLLSAASTTTSCDSMLYNLEESVHSSRVSPEVNIRPTTPESPLAGVSVFADSPSWVSHHNYISKPPGEPGRPGSGGYNINEAMSWPKKEYCLLQVGICGYWF